MVLEIELSDTVVGRKTSLTREAFGVATALFIIAATYTLVSHFVEVPIWHHLLFVNVLFGLGLALVYAYRNDGLLISWTLALAPLGGAMAFSHWEAAAGGTDFLSGPFQLYGYGALEFWLPAGFLFGTACYFAGVYARRVVEGVRPAR